MSKSIAAQKYIKKLKEKASLNDTFNKSQFNEQIKNSQYITSGIIQETRQQNNKESICKERLANVIFNANNDQRNLSSFNGSFYVSNASH